MTHALVFACPPIAVKMFSIIKLAAACVHQQIALVS
jgi:hypothetical protein